MANFIPIAVESLERASCSGAPGAALLVLALGCQGPNSVTSAESGETSPSSDEVADESETGSPACIDEDCATECAEQLDECGVPLTGSCVASVCDCELVEPCIDCRSDLDCGLWELCVPDWGGCTSWCTDHVITWAREGDCVLDFSTVPERGIPYIHVYIEAMELPYVAVCDDVAMGWTWIPEEQLELCPATCAAFERGAELGVEMHCPSD